MVDVGGSQVRQRWSRKFWILELVSLASILVIVLLLQYSEEGYMRRNGIRVSASVGELAPSRDSCVECPLVFTLHGERYRVNESLSQQGGRRYVSGEAVELFVDPDDMTHVIQVDLVEENVVLGVVGIGIAVFFAVGWPVCEFKRPIPEESCPAVA